MTKPFKLTTYRYSSTYRESQNFSENTKKFQIQRSITSRANFLGLKYLNATYFFQINNYLSVAYFKIL